MKIRDRDIPAADRKLQPQHLFVRLAGWVAAFSPECEICRRLQNQITRLDVSQERPASLIHPGLTGYLDVMKSIVSHLKHSHGLVERRHYVKRCLFVSLTFGLLLVLFLLILLSFGITLLAWNITVIAIVIRVIFSYLVGYILDRRKAKQGVVI